MRTGRRTEAVKTFDARGCQTEQSWLQMGGVNSPKQMADLAAQHAETLARVRDMIKVALTDVGCSTYDLMAYKDVVLAVSQTLPDMPVMDLVLLCSKLFRRTSELGRLVGIFFNMVFAEDFVDEDFHFVELRLARREIQQLRQQLNTVTAEKKALQELYDELGQGSLNHVRALEVLETRNDVLELRSAALEDQMAILFQQVAEETRNRNTVQLQKTMDDMDVQEQLSATRTAFAQSVETVQSRLKFFQGLLLELQEEPAAQQDGGFRNKVKALDVHVQHIIGRFSAVKDGLMGTAQELLTALTEKRKALNFSAQHLKLYEQQNQKLRGARSLLHEVRQRVHDVERMLQHTFPMGAVERVERTGDIVSLVSGTVSAAAAAHSDANAADTGGGSHNTQKYVATSVRDLLERVQMLSDSAVRMTAVLDVEDEQRTLVRMISLNAPTSGRQDVPAQERKVALAPPTASHLFFQSSAQQPAVNVNTERSIVPFNKFDNNTAGMMSGGGTSSTGGGGGRAGRASITGLLAGPSSVLGGSSSPGQGPSSAAPTTCADPVALIALRDDYTSKINFLRDVYEDRISDLEARLERTSLKLTTTQGELLKLQKEETMKKELLEREAVLRAKEAWAAQRGSISQDLRDVRSDGMMAMNESLDGGGGILGGGGLFGPGMATTGVSSMMTMLQQTSIPQTEYTSTDRPASARTVDSMGSGMEAFISPQAKLQVLRQNAEKKQNDPAVVIFTATPMSKRGPMLRTDAAVQQQERNEQFIRALRRLTQVEEQVLEEPTANKGAGRRTSASNKAPPKLTRKQ